MNFDRTSAIAGIVFAIVLVVLDKAGKLKGPALLVLLGIAALMLFPLALGNSWIRETPWGMLKFSKMTLMISIVGVCYSGFAVWISQSNSSEDTHSRYQTTDNLPRQDSNEEQKKLPGPYQPTQHEPRMDRKEPLQYSKKPATKTSDEKPPTMLDLFKRDFSYAAKVGLNDAAVKSGADGFELKIKRQVYLDFQGKSQFVGFYLESGNDFPQNERCYRAALLLAGHVPEAIAEVRKNIAVGAGFPGQMTSLEDLSFTGRVLIYHSDELSITQQADIVKAFKTAGFDVQFRGPGYLGDQVIAWHRQHDKKEAQ